MSVNYVGFNGPLSLTANAILAQQLGIQSTAANIANANAPGYHRIDTVISAGGTLGGVESAELVRAGNQLLEQQQTLQLGTQSQAFNRKLLLDAQMRPLLGTTDPALSISGALSQLFTSLGTLSGQPASGPIRNAMLTTATTLTDRINTAADNLLQQQEALNTRTEVVVNLSNDLLETIADLNNRVTEGKAAGVPTGDLEDQRYNAANDLSKLMGTKVLWDQNGQMRIVLGVGTSLVSSVEYSPLSLTVDPQTPTLHLSVANTPMTNVDADAGGEAGAIVQVRDGDLATIRTTLDQFAADLATAFNTVHNASFSSDGTATTGMNFFNVPTSAAPTGYANQIAVNPDIVANNGALLGVASVTPVASGDNSGIAALLALDNASIANNNTMTLQTALGTMLTSVGDTLQSAQSNLDSQDALVQNIDNMVDSQAGVSISEQILQLSRFQTAFAAATRVVSTVDQMLQSLMGM